MLGAHGAGAVGWGGGGASVLKGGGAPRCDLVALGARGWGNRPVETEQQQSGGERVFGVCGGCLGEGGGLLCMPLNVRQLLGALGGGGVAGGGGGLPFNMNAVCTSTTQQPGCDGAALGAGGWGLVAGATDLQRLSSSRVEVRWLLGCRQVVHREGVCVGGGGGLRLSQGAGC